MEDLNENESFEEQVPEEARGTLVRRLLNSGADAPRVLLQTAVNANGAWAQKYAARSHAGDGADVDELVRRVIKAHAILARTEGAGVAAAISAAEATSVVGTAGTLTPATVVTGLVGDIAGLAWIQTRMILVIAALHGHDPTDAVRYREIATLMGIFGAPQADRAAKAAGKASERVLRRLILRHLKGDRLQAVKALFRMVGVNFTRTGLIKALPGINIPISALVNAQATRSLGKRAHVYYSTLPPSAGADTAFGGG